MAKWNKVGQILRSKKGLLYIKMDKDVTLKKGDALQLRDPRKSLEEAVAKGKMSAEKAEEMLSKIRDFVRQDVIQVTEE